MRHKTLFREYMQVITTKNNFHCVERHVESLSNEQLWPILPCLFKMLKEIPKLLLVLNL